MYTSVLRFLLIGIACIFLQPVLAQPPKGCFMGALVSLLNDPKTSQAYKNAIKEADNSLLVFKKLGNSLDISKDIEVFKASSSFLSRHADFLTNNPGNFEGIIKNLTSYQVGVRCAGCRGKNAGIPTLAVIIDDMDWALTQFKGGNVNIQKLFRDMAMSSDLNFVNAFKADGGAYIISVLRTNARQNDNFVSTIKKFEYKYLDDGSFEADVALEVGGKMLLSEYKSWRPGTWKLFTEKPQYIKQFMAYVKKKQDFEYVINVSKLDDLPLSEIKRQFAKVIRKNAETLFADNPTFFKNVLHNGKPIKMDNFNDLETYAALLEITEDATEFSKSTMFNFIKPK